MLNTSSRTETRYVLRRDTVDAVLERLCWTQEALADEVGVSRVHFNRLLNQRRPLTRRCRRKLLDCAQLRGLKPDDLWVCQPGDPE